MPGSSSSSSGSRSGSSSSSSSSSATSYSIHSSSSSSSKHPASLIDATSHSPLLLSLLALPITPPVTDYLVDTVAETVDYAMGRRPSPPSPNGTKAGKRRRPDLSKFTSFVSTVLTRAEVTFPVLLSSLVYIERAKPHLHIALEEWALERVFLGALIVASKYLNDSTLKNVHWALCTGVFGKRDVGRIEREFLDVLDFELAIREDDLLTHNEGILSYVASASPSPAKKSLSSSEKEKKMSMSMSVLEAAGLVSVSVPRKAPLPPTTGKERNHHRSSHSHSSHHITLPIPTRTSSHSSSAHRPSRKPVRTHSYSPSSSSSSSDSSSDGSVSPQTPSTTDSSPANPGDVVVDRAVRFQASALPIPRARSRKLAMGLGGGVGKEVKHHPLLSMGTHEFPIRLDVDGDVEMV